MKDRFDCIIVGAGFAGSAAAIQLAREGVSVLLIVRAEKVGQKNVSGGVMWGHELDDLTPGWETEAPLERFIDHKRLSFLIEDSAFTIDFKSTAWDEAPRDGRVVGVRGVDADCVILADGINSRLTMQVGLRGPLKRPPGAGGRRGDISEVQRMVIAGDMLK